MFNNVRRFYTIIEEGVDLSSRIFEKNFPNFIPGGGNWLTQTLNIKGPAMCSGYVS